MINVLWPTIRPEVAMAQSQQWLDAAADPGHVSIEFGVNSDEHAAKIRIDTFRTLTVVRDVRAGVTATATALSQYVAHEAADDGVIVLASDDFEAPEGWDNHLLDIENLNALIVNDGYKPDTNIIPMPVVSGAYLRQLNGILYHPQYSHFFSDQEMYDVTAQLGGVINLRGTSSPKFSHKHWSFGGRKKDEFDLRNNAWWNQDKATYEKRKSWPIEKKLEVMGY